MILRFGVAALLLLPSAAFAQGNPGPFGGLFGRAPERTGSEFTAIDFRSAAAGQYDDTILLDESIPDGDVPRSGYTSGVNTGIILERRSDRLRFRAQGGATYQEYYRKPVFGATAYDAGLMFRAQPATRLHLLGQAGFNRSPYFRFLPGLPAFESAVTTPSDSLAVRLMTTQSYDVGGGFVSQYSKHSSLTFEATQQETRFGETVSDTFRLAGMEATWRHQLSRSFAVHAGYGRERGRHSSQPDQVFLYELIDVGVDFNRQLSDSRRTTLAFTTKTGAVTRPLTGRRYRVNGNAALTTHFRRTWLLSAGYSRDTEFLPGFFEPLFTDAVAVTVGGMLTARGDWQTTVSAGEGNFGFDNNARYETAHTRSRLNWALTRRLGLFAEYSIYYHKLPPTPTGIALPTQLSRQAFAVGFNTWIPILNRMRAPRDPE